MFSFGYPHMLVLLAIIPVLFGLFVWSRKAREKKLKKFGQLSVLSQLMPDVSRYTPWIKIGLELVLILVIVVMLARPRAKTGVTSSNMKVQGSEVVIALDISNSMRASSTDDVDGISRLQQSKFLVQKLFDRLRNDKVGLVVFAGDAFVQMPVTDDFSSAKLFLNSLSTDMIPNQGTAIGAAIDMSMSLFSADKQCQRSIILITDGENHEDDAAKMAKAAAEKGVVINVVGAGTPKPMAIPMGNGTYLRDGNGQIAMTTFNEAAASELARIGSGVYVSANNANAVNVLDDQMKKAVKSNMERRVFSPSDEQFPVFAWVALVLLLLDILLTDQKISWLRKTNFFGK